MLGILWLLLKIIGIILLAILGIVLLIICSVLFVPVRYRAEAESDATQEGTLGQGRISWMFHLISACFTYREGKLDWQLRVFWKKMNGKQDAEKPDSGEAALKESSSETDLKGSVAEESAAEKIVPKESALEENVEEETLREESGKAERKKTERKKAERKKVSLSDKIEKVKAFVEDASHQSAFLRVKKEIFRLLRFLRPKALKGRVHFGFEDPYHTGQVLAFLSMLYPFYGDSISIEPDFERKILEGKLFVKGHVRGIYAVILVWNLFFDKDVRTAYKHIRAFEF